jgi:septation ring formation regulator EzrA
MEAREEIEKLVGELDYYTQQMDFVGTVLVDLTKSKRKNQALISKASDIYRLLTLDVVETYTAIKRVYRNAGLNR